MLNDVTGAGWCKSSNLLKWNLTKVKIWNQSSNANQIVWEKTSKVEQEGTGKQPHWSLFTFEAKKVLRWPFWLSDGRTETWVRRLRLQYVVWSALILLKILDLQNNEYLSDWTQVSLCWLIKALQVQIDILTFSSSVTAWLFPHPLPSLIPCLRTLSAKTKY